MYRDDGVMLDEMEHLLKLPNQYVCDASAR